MARYAIIENGAVVNVAVADEPQHENWREVPENARAEIGDTFDGQTYAPPLDVAKLAKWEAVKAIRNTKENGEAPTPFGPVQCDDTSKIKVSGLVTMAFIAKSNAQPFSGGFTLADNSVVTLNADQAIGMGIATGRYVSALHERARELRVAIEAAQTIAALDAIDHTAGWP